VSELNMTLGKLIELLEQQPADNRLTLGYGVPTGEVCSYRGYYKDLAIVFASYSDSTVESLLFLFGLYG
jgi:hypothetical protein